MDYFNSERYAAALEILPSEQTAKTTAIGDYILLYRGKASLMLEQYKEALEDFRILENQYSDSSLLRDAHVGQCQAFLGLKDPKSALAALASHKTDENSEILFYQASALDQAGNKDQAISLYLQLYSKYALSKWAPAAEYNLLSLFPKSLSGANNYGIRLQRAENLFRANELSSALKILTALGRVSAADNTTSQKRYLLLAEVEYRLERTKIALTHLQKVTDADPALHSRALYLEGACNRRLEREQTFLALRDKALKLYPLSQNTEELAYSVATYYDVNYEYAKARDAYEVLYRAFPKGRHAEGAHWKLCMFSYLAGQYGEAALGFWNYLQTYPRPASAISAMYWLGRCFEKLGKSGNAHYLYSQTQSLANYSYYGQRARDAAASLRNSGNIENTPFEGLDFKQIMTTSEAIRVAPILLSEPDNAGARILERARQLVASGLPEFALSELRWGIRRYPQNDELLYYVMSKIYASRGDYNEAISCLRTVYPDYSSRPEASMPEEVWQLLYPTRFLNIISEQASQTQTDPALILGIIRQESAFDEKARSKANARGLMQVLPSTGRKLARQARIRRYNSQKLFQAETNIMLGTRHLASLLSTYGKAEIVLASYNAGTTRADRWLKEFGDDDMAEFVERIPFYETRNYVKQVMSNRAYYSLVTSSSARAAQ